MLRQTPSPSKPKPQPRRGAAVVEFAIVLPLFMTLTFASIEAGHALSVVQKLESVVREGGRMASKDVPTALLDGLTPNQKVTHDIQNMLKADGFPAANIVVAIVHADGATAGQTFDLALKANQYKLMRITVTIPYADVSMLPWSIDQSAVLRASLVTSRGRSSLNN